MSRRRSRWITRPGWFGARCALGLALLAGTGCGPAPGEGMEALTGATVIDVASGRALPDAVILVRDGHIVSVGGDELEVPAGAHKVDLRGHWVIPGLIDAHVHLQPWGDAAALEYGVTSVRDLHDGLAGAESLRVAATSHPAPRHFAAIAMLDAPPTTYPDALPVTDSASIAAAIDSLAARGAALVKVYTRITPPLLEQIVASARAHQLPVAAHLGLTDALTAARLGVVSIEHLSGIPEAAGDSVALFAAHSRGFFAGWTAFERSWTTLDTAALADVAAGLVAQRVVLVPTLVLHETFAHLDDSAVYHTAAMHAVPDSAYRNWNVAGMIQRAGWTADDFAAFRAARPVQDSFLRRFVAAGGRVVVGTDASNQLLVPGAAVHQELALLVAAGLSPINALRGATSWAAELLHADSLGRLRPGAVADLVVLDADPLADIHNSARISRVMLGGKWVPR